MYDLLNNIAQQTTKCTHETRNIILVVEDKNPWRKGLLLTIILLFIGWRFLLVSLMAAASYAAAPRELPVYFSKNLGKQANNFAYTDGEMAPLRKEANKEKV